jgi:hypothetical protein
MFCSQLSFLLPGNLCHSATVNEPMAKSVDCINTARQLAQEARLRAFNPAVNPYPRSDALHWIWLEAYQRECRDAYQAASAFD